MTKKRGRKPKLSNSAVEVAEEVKQPAVEYQIVTHATLTSREATGERVHYRKKFVGKFHGLDMRGYRLFNSDISEAEFVQCNLQGWLLDADTKKTGVILTDCDTRFSGGLK